MRREQSGSGYANSVTWGYDDNNNLSTQKQTLNGTTYTTSYTYDKDNRLTKTMEGTVSAGYTYDALGQPAEHHRLAGRNPRRTEPPALQRICLRHGDGAVLSAEQVL